MIGGAHFGKGLGHDFLRHVAHTGVLIHMVDGSSAKPEEDLARVNTELALYDEALAKKPQLVVVNKIDMPSVRNKREDMTVIFRGAGIEPYFISAATGEGVDDLMAATMDIVETRRYVQREGVREKEEEKLFKPGARIGRPRVYKEGGTFYVESPGLERIVEGGGDGTEAYCYVRRRLERQGIDRELKRMGISEGDRVRLGSVEWEWSEVGRERKRKGMGW